jgi:hypothetical protein
MIRRICFLLLVPPAGLAAQATASFLIDPATGAIRSLGTDLPAVTAATADDVLIVHEDPVPRFELRSLDLP